MLKNEELFANTERQLDIKQKIATFRGCSIEKALSFPSVHMQTQSDVDRFSGHSLYKMFFDFSIGSLVYGRLVIPITTPTGVYVSYVAYDVIAQIEARQGKGKKPAYLAPSHSNKGSLVYVPNNSWSRVIDSDVIYIVDGVWDSITINYLGLPAMALLGSTITPEIHQILGTFREIILVQDNDHAGVALFLELCSRFNQVSRVGIPALIAKDIDEFHNKTSDKDALNLLKRR